MLKRCAPPRVKWIIALFIICAGWSPAARAGGGPENLILVVNQNSPSSLAVANLYIELRQIPPSNVVYINVPFGADAEQVPLAQFREKILKPVMEAIHARHLDGQIDYIVYSADFPTTIDVNAVTQKFLQSQPGLTKEQAKLFKGYASINAMTFYAGAALEDSPAFLSLDGNWYARPPIGEAIGTAFEGDDDRNLRSALIALETGKYPDAKTLLEALIKKYPLQFAPRLLLVRCCAGMEQPKETADALSMLARTGWSHRKTVLEFKEFSQVASDAAVKSALEKIPDDATPYVHSHAFRRIYLWARNGGLNNGTDQGRNYILSTVLAVTRNNGTTLQDALAYLRRAAAADFTHPQGDFYFALTADVRTKTRQPGFDAAIAGLKQLGLGAEIVNTDVPMRKQNVLGAMLGEKSAQWPPSQSELLPGAIVDNFTSVGGKMQGPGHTPATEFLRWGAAGSSGTVVEPYAVQAKFAHPLIFVHYARGYTMAEAYYQSVRAPFQLLIVGDALCQPFATPIPFEVDGLEPGATIKGKVGLTVSTNEPDQIDHYELFLDGLRSNVNPRIGKFNFDADKISDGYHELRIVAVANRPLETQSRKIIPFFIDQNGAKVTLSVDRAIVSAQAEMEITATAETVGPISIYQNSRVIGTIEKSGQPIRVPAAKLGAGHSRIYAVAPINGVNIQSEPLSVQVD
jgi:uncharacterized protein (TIGR03790 family)